MKDSVLILAALIAGHIALWIGDVVVINLLSGGRDAFYGGQYGFIPSTGNPDNRYDTAAAFLFGAHQTMEPGNTFTKILAFMFQFGPCQIAELYRLFFTYTSLTGYNTVQAIPSTGFPLFIKLVIQLAGTFGVVLMGINIADWLASRGFFQNNVLLVAVGFMAVVGGAVFFTLARLVNVGCF